MNRGQQIAIGAIVDIEWRGAIPVPSSTGDVERVYWIPPTCDRFGLGAKDQYWRVVIGGREWGVRPSDPAHRALLDEACGVHPDHDPGDER